MDSPAAGGAPAAKPSFQAGEVDWPQAWFEPFKTASELGIVRFSESPALTAARLAGADPLLPPVHERLPADPVVVTPYRSIGKYGGVARITLDDIWTFFNWEAALTLSPDMRTVLPNLAESYAVSEDGRTTSIRLRRGLRWSDGEPLTSDDFVFTFNHIWLDAELNPVTSPLVRGGRIVKIDDRNFQYVFQEPSPLFVNLIGQFGSRMVDAEHYFADFHPAYTNREALAARAKEAGFINWMAWVRALKDSRIAQSAEVPTLRAYRVVSRTLQMMRLERNPYYFKIDPAGNQLPYIIAVPLT